MPSATVRLQATLRAQEELLHCPHCQAVIARRYGEDYQLHAWTAHARIAHGRLRYLVVVCPNERCRKAVEIT